MSEHPIMKQGNDPEEIPVPKEPQSVQDEYGSEVAQQHTSDAMISGALPVMWLILIALAVMKLVPLSPESPLPDALPGWLGLAASFAVLAGMTGLAGIPSARKAIAMTQQLAGDRLNEERGANADFIAAANPLTVRALINQLRAAQAGVN